MTRRTYGFDFLNTLSQKIGDLSGFVQMSRELVQNADDERCEWISIQFTKNALIVRNPSKFSEADFVKITLIGGEGKIDAPDKTGRFGVGFVSVFQICDHPVIRSNGSQLTIFPEDQSADDLKIEHSDGTEFVFDWARDLTVVRERLKRDLISDAKIETFRRELISSLPETMLFLRHLTVISVINEDGTTIKAVRLPDKDNIRTIKLLNEKEDIPPIGLHSWFVLENPATAVEEVSKVTRNNGIGVAVKIGTRTKPGDLGTVYCTLPTRTPTGLPISVNGDFSIKSDRMTLVDEGSSPDVSWNRELVKRLGDLYVKMILEARGNVPDSDYATLLPPDQYSNPSCPMFKGIYDTFFGAGKTEKIIKVTHGSKNNHWASAGQARLISNSANPSLYTCIRELGGSLVVASLETRRNLMQKLGVKPFSIEDLPSVLEKHGITLGSVVEVMPKILNSDTNLETLYDFLTNEIRNRNFSKDVINLAKTLPLCPCLDGKWYPFAQCIGIENDIVNTLRILQIKYPIVSEDFKSEHRILFDKLCSTRDLDILVEELREKTSDDIHRMFNNNELDIVQLYDCLTTREDSLMSDKDMVSQVAGLNVFPASKSLTFKKLADLKLPGEFEDTIGIDILIDAQLLDHLHLKTLKTIFGLTELTIKDYIKYLCPRYFDDYSSFTKDDKRIELLRLIKTNLGKIEEDETLLDLVANAPCILCVDGSYRKPDECFMDVTSLPAIFRQYPEPNRVYGGKSTHADWVRFMGLIGVKTRPSVTDMIRATRQASAKSFMEALPLIEEAFYYIANSFAELDEHQKAELEQLRDIEWLPVLDEDVLELPRNIYLNSVAKLVGKQGKILRFKRETFTKDFRERIGLNEPTPTLIIDNLTALKEQNIQPDVFIYQRLNDYINWLSLDDKHRLAEEPMLWIDEKTGFVKGSKVFWSPHPFGVYRFIINDEYRAFQRLMQDVMGVKNAISEQDYLDVLLEISADGDRIDDGTYTVAQNIYAYLSSCLGSVDVDDRDSVEKEWRTFFNNRKIILTHSREMKQTDHCFFADKDWAIRIFKTKIENLLVDKTPHTWPFMSAVGVRPLSSAVRTEHFEEPQVTRSSEIQKLLRSDSRLRAFKRIIETHKQTNPRQEWRMATVENLEITECDNLEVEFSILVNNQNVLSGLQNPDSHYEETTSNLFILERLDQEIKLLEIARRIAGILNPSMDPAILSSQIKYIIDPTLDDNRVHQYLTYIGIDELGDLSQPKTPDGPKTRPEESIFDNGDDEEPQVTESIGRAGPSGSGEVSGSPSSRQGHQKSTKSEEDVEHEVKTRKEYFKRKRDYYNARDDFEKGDSWSKESFDDDRSALTDQEKEEHVRNVRVFYNREIRKIERHINELSSANDIYDIYTSEWKTISEEIRERDGNKCRRCGMTSEELKQVGSHLTVHHIYPRKEGGSNWPSNLITLCISCHREVEGHPELL